MPEMSDLYYFNSELRPNSEFFGSIYTMMDLAIAMMKVTMVILTHGMLSSRKMEVGNKPKNDEINVVKKDLIKPYIGLLYKFIYMFNYL